MKTYTVHSGGQTTVHVMSPAMEKISNDLTAISDREPQMNLARFYTGRRQDYLGGWHFVVLDRKNPEFVEFCFGPAEAGQRAKGFNESGFDTCDDARHRSAMAKVAQEMAK